MDDRFIDQLYLTVIGQLEPEYAVAGVEDSFAAGGVCDHAYETMRKAYIHVLNRLGKENEDHDLELIVSCMEQIQKEIAYQMYRYGTHFGIADEIEL